jgi:dihydrofolate reductase
MPRIVESTLMSADGVIEDPAQWAGDYMDAGFQKGALDRLLVSDAMLMGRVTYEMLARDWASGTDTMAARVNSMRKYLVSSTIGEPEWRNTVVLRGDVLAEIRKLREMPGSDIAIYGHGRLAETLLANGLLDEIRVSTFPLFVGVGKRMFRAGQTARFELIETLALAKGVVVSRYLPEGARR